MINLIQVLLFVGSIQGFLISIFLFSIRTNKIANRILGIVTLIWGLVLMVFALKDQGLYIKFPHLLWVFDQTLFLLFPLLFLHVKYLLTRLQKFRTWDMLHFIPFILSIIVHFQFFLLPAEIKYEMLENPSRVFILIEMISNEVLAVQGVIYSIMSLRMIWSYKKKIRNYVSTIEKDIINVLNIGISLNLISWSIGIIGIHLEYLNVPIGFDFFAYTYLVLVIVIYVISYAVFKSPEIFKIDESEIRERRILRPVPGADSTDQKTSKIRKEETETYIDTADNEELAINDLNEKLIKYMLEEKPHLNPELTLPELATNLEFSRNQLSGIINQVHKKNFYEFVNEYRVDEVKRLMNDPANKHLKMISLAYDAGFNSKASFYRIFKQLTKMTPSEYFSTT